MAFKMRSGNKPAFKQMGSSSPMKALPALAVRGGLQLAKKGAQKLAKNKKVQKKVVEPIKKGAKTLLEKGKDWLNKNKMPISIAAGASTLMGSRKKKDSKNNKDNKDIKVNKDMSVDTKTGVVKSKKQTAAKNKIESNRKTKPG